MVAASPPVPRTRAAQLHPQPQGLELVRLELVEGRGAVDDHRIEAEAAAAAPRQHVPELKGDHGSPAYPREGAKIGNGPLTDHRYPRRFGRGRPVLQRRRGDGAARLIHQVDLEIGTGIPLYPGDDQPILSRGDLDGDTPASGDGLAQTGDTPGARRARGRRPYLPRGTP